MRLGLGVRLEKFKNLKLKLGKSGNPNSLKRYWLKASHVIFDNTNSHKDCRGCVSKVLVELEGSDGYMTLGEGAIHILISTLSLVTQCCAAPTCTTCLPRLYSLSAGSWLLVFYERKSFSATCPGSVAMRLIQLRLIGSWV